MTLTALVEIDTEPLADVGGDVTTDDHINRALRLWAALDNPEEVLDDAARAGVETEILEVGSDGE